ERLMKMISDRRRVEFADAALLGPNRASKIAIVIDTERDIGVERLADGLSVIDRICIGEKLEILLHAIGNLEENVAAFGHARFSPSLSRLMGRIERGLDILGRGARGLRIDLPADRRDD